MRRLAALALTALLVLAACGGTEEEEMRSARFGFLELPTPSGWVSGSYQTLSDANFALFPYPAQNEIALSLFARGATAGWSTVSASDEGVMSEWIIAATFDRPSDPLILPALTASLLEGMPWSGEKPALTKVSETEFSVSGETADEHRYIRTFMDDETIVVVFAGTASTDHETFESILARISLAAPAE